MESKEIQVAAAEAAGADGPGPATERGPKRIILIDDAYAVFSGVGLPMQLEVIPFYNLKELDGWLTWMQAEGVEIVNFIDDVAVAEALRALGIDLPARTSERHYSWELGDFVVVARLRGSDLEAYLIIVK
jgi:hypothetical protein